MKIKIPMPGLRKEDIKIKATPTQITVTAKRQQAIEKKRKNFFSRQEAYQSYSHTQSLPEKIDPKSVKYAYKTGVLTIEAKKAKHF